MEITAAKIQRARDKALDILGAFSRDRITHNGVKMNITEVAKALGYPIFLTKNPEHQVSIMPHGLRRRTAIYVDDSLDITEYAFSVARALGYLLLDRSERSVSLMEFNPSMIYPQDIFAFHLLSLGEEAPENTGDAVVAFSKEHRIPISVTRAFAAFQEALDADYSHGGVSEDSDNG